MRKDVDDEINCIGDIGQGSGILPAHPKIVLPINAEIRNLSVCFHQRDRIEGHLLNSMKPSFNNAKRQEVKVLSRILKYGINYYYC
jgi:hypothetical protein